MRCPICWSHIQKPHPLPGAHAPASFYPESPPEPLCLFIYFFQEGALVTIWSMVVCCSMSLAWAAAALGVMHVLVIVIFVVLVGMWCSLQFACVYRDDPLTARLLERCNSDLMPFGVVVVVLTLSVLVLLLLLLLLLCCCCFFPRCHCCCPPSHRVMHLQLCKSNNQH